MRDDSSNHSPGRTATERPEEDGRRARAATLKRLSFIRAAVASVAARLRFGGAMCVKVEGTFPQQFICAGTSDQIERLLREPDL